MAAGTQYPKGMNMDSSGVKTPAVYDANLDEWVMKSHNYGFDGTLWVPQKVESSGVTDVNVSNTPSVNVGNTPNVQLSSSIPAGANVIGQVKLTDGTNGLVVDSHGALKIIPINSAGTELFTPTNPGNVQLTGRNVLNTFRSVTNTPLAAGATYTQAWQDIQGNQMATSISLYADQACIVSLDISPDGGTRVDNSYFSVLLPPNCLMTSPPIRTTRYYRWRIQNYSGSAQTVLEVNETVIKDFISYPTVFAVPLAYNAQIRDTLEHAQWINNLNAFAKAMIRGVSPKRVQFSLENTLDQALTVTVYSFIGPTAVILGTYSLGANTKKIITSSDFPALNGPLCIVDIKAVASAAPTTGALDAYIALEVG